MKLEMDRRFREIDFIKGIAIIWVVVFHMFKDFLLILIVGVVLTRLEKQLFVVFKRFRWTT